MTLADFRRDTADMPGSTPLAVLDPSGGIEAAAILTVEDLVPGDPLCGHIPPGSIVITASADEGETSELLSFTTSTP